MAEAKPISTPMVAGTKLSKDGDNLMQDVQLYRDAQPVPAIALQLGDRVEEQSTPQDSLEGEDTK
ncbi:uncharacterized protein G2W53_042018 [Senna tora]|uniref:Uncharacterized protein n=1 Tax=Senna tora TaxID=362788 RepID=A0A834SKX0_9FABA|nr:uncharacterized protein G2W53_042018 [Senna tora]